jgi:hypothetical protein
MPQKITPSLLLSRPILFRRIVDGVGLSISQCLKIHSASKLNDSNWSTEIFVDMSLIHWFLSYNLPSSFSLDNIANAECILALEL